eukprot:scaffold8611_cov108-Isochrysis_galbana.AAC.2
MASETKYKRPRLGRRRFPLHHHLPHATGRTHSLQTSNTSSTAPSHHPRKRTHPPMRHPLPHVRAQKGKLLAHGGVQRDPQIIHAHQLTQGTRGPLCIPPPPPPASTKSHPHPLRHPGRGSPPSKSQLHDYSMEKHTHLILQSRP